MLLKELCTTGVFQCPRDTTALEAARMMSEAHIGAIVIVDEPDDRAVPVGIITDRDIAVRVIGKGLDAARTTVGSIMRVPLVFADESEDTSTALSRMQEHGVRRLAVTSGHGRLAGIVTLDDLMRLLHFELETLLDIVAKEQDLERRRG